MSIPPLVPDAKPSHQTLDAIAAVIPTDRGAEAETVVLVEEDLRVHQPMRITETPFGGCPWFETGGAPCPGCSA